MSKHNRGVIVRTWIVVIIMLICGCFLDSYDFELFFTIMALGTIYMTIFTIVNRDYLARRTGYYDDEE